MPDNGFGWATCADEVMRGIEISGKQVVLTGGSSGIGVETARVLAAAGAEAVLGVRDVGKGEGALSDIAPDTRKRMHLLELDLRNFDSIHAFASEISGPLDVFVANAGVSKTPDAHLPNGLDVRFATNHLGHFLLAHLLKGQMAGRNARIVVVSSAAHKGMPVRMDDLQWQAREHFDGAAYAESKSANILFAQEANRLWSGLGITANAVLPGSVMTGLQRFHGDALKRQIGFINPDGSLNEMVKTTEQGAATSAWAATSPDLEGKGGLVLEDCNIALPVGPDTHPWSGFDEAIADPEVARQLWEHSLELLRDLAGYEPD
ncbi:MAG: SDR family NAD(P)-dependent oxidoreductase [Novosphingobium sp.]|nr:SDR family NAD(P)-dependent oxidoreductase [Novosphingobium sp.]